MIRLIENLLKKRLFSSTLMIIIRTKIENGFTISTFMEIKMNLKNKSNFTRLDILKRQKLLKARFNMKTEATYQHTN